jgi:hypothetical protein
MSASSEPADHGPVAVVAVHGVADQSAGQTVHELARLLAHGGDHAPLYTRGQARDVLIPVAPLRPPAPTCAAGPAMRQALLPRPGGSSRFHEARQARAAAAASEPDLGLAYTDFLLSRYVPAQQETLYASTMISLQRRADGRRVDLYELYWADCSRLRPGGVRALSALYQLFFHLTTLARDMVDHAALATGHARGFALLQSLFAWTTWLLKLPAALIQLAMLLMLAFGAAGLVPAAQRAQLLPAAAIVLAAGFLGLAALAWVRRKAGAGRLDAATAAALGAAAASLALALFAKLHPELVDRMYFASCAVLVGAIGILLVERYRRLVLDARVVGLPLMLCVVVALFVAHPQALSAQLPLSERMVLAALRVGELLLALMLAVWAALVTVQAVALVLTYPLAARHARPIAQTLATARLGTVCSSALFALLSLVLWAVLVALVGLALKDGPNYDPLIFGGGFPSATWFLEQRLLAVGNMFMPLVMLSSLLALFAIYALAPALREELAPRRADPQTAASADAALASERLGRWWSWGRRAVMVNLGRALPLLALLGAATYLAFVGGALAGLLPPDLLDGSGGATLLAIGQWLAGGAVTVTALGARFTRNFGKLRVALDAVLDIDNYLRDPADGRSPRAAIFSRAAAVLAELRARGYRCIVLVAHSQGTVICGDLLHWLQQRGRRAGLVGADTELALVTVGSPLRDLYAPRFPLLYGWMQPAPAAFDRTDAAPDPAALGVATWVNGYRSGDYVGRAIWRSEADPLLFQPAAPDPGRRGISRQGRRAEFCLGSGAHTHYFDDDAVVLAQEIDRLVAAARAPAV